MSKAFLSHSSAQASLVKAIADKLGRDNCIIDQYHFESGSPTLEDIFKSINSSDLFVLFLSRESLSSEWVKREIEIATTLRNPTFKSRIAVFLIDPSLEIQDSQIPDWLKEEFNLKPIYDTVLLYKKIDSCLRNLRLSKYPNINRKESIFVGRNQLMEQFESRYNTLDGTKPSYIIVSGLEEAGRKKFIRHALDKAERINKFHGIISIPLDARDSIEDFIVRLEDQNSKSIFEIAEKVNAMDLDAKITYAKELLIAFRDTNEILFLIDKGCVVQANKRLADWFTAVLHNGEFANTTVVCVIATNRPHYAQVEDKKSLAFHVSELSPIDTRVLFSRYCQELFNISPPKEKTEQIVEVMTGMPGQVYHAVDLINSNGVDYALRNIEEIKKYNDIRVFQLIENIRTEGELLFDILVFISKIEFISFDLVYRIYGRTTEVEQILDKLYTFGVFDHIGIDREYIQVHFAIADYVLRSKFIILPNTRKRLREELENILSGKYEYPDVSQLLLTVRSMVKEGVTVSEKHLLPSFLLRTIVDSYYEGKYANVKEFAKKILDNPARFDKAIVREIRYWYAQSIVRRVKAAKKGGYDEFFEQLRFFQGGDYHFLLGFQRRLSGKVKEAEASFRTAIDLDMDSQKSKRELVNVLLIQNKFDEALELAMQNYSKKKLNAFHIQAYFIALTRKKTLNGDDRKVITELMSSMVMSHDHKANEIRKCMEAEHDFYVKGDAEKAIERLMSIIEDAQYKSYPRRALLEIYKRRGYRQAEESLKRVITLANDDSTLLE